MCGEKALSTGDVKMKLGSPPRVRGEVLSMIIQNLPQRITPACAGRSLDLSSRCAHAGDHPRVCGEKSRARSPHKGFRGSPPRVRGEG